MCLSLCVCVYVLEQAVVLDRGRLHVAGDQDGDDERVNGDDAGHDDGDQALHDQVGPEGADACDPDPGLGRAVRGADACGRGEKENL